MVPTQSCSKFNLTVSKPTQQSSSKRRQKRSCEGQPSADVAVICSWTISICVRRVVTEYQMPDLKKSEHDKATSVCETSVLLYRGRWSYLIELYSVASLSSPIGGAVPFAPSLQPQSHHFPLFLNVFPSTHKTCIRRCLLFVDCMMVLLFVSIAKSKGD